MYIYVYIFFKDPIVALNHRLRKEMREYLEKNPKKTSSNVKRKTRNSGGDSNIATDKQSIDQNENKNENEKEDDVEEQEEYFGFTDNIEFLHKVKDRQTVRSFTLLTPRQRVEQRQRDLEKLLLHGHSNSNPDAENVDDDERFWPDSGVFDIIFQVSLY